MTTVISAIVTAVMIVIGVIADLLIDESPVIMFALGALALTIGVIAMPIGEPQKKGSDRGFY